MSILAAVYRLLSTRGMATSLSGLPSRRRGVNTAWIERHLTDPRTGRNCQFALPDLLRQSIYSRLAGYDTNDAERLAQDPVLG